METNVMIPRNPNYGKEPSSNPSPGGSNCSDVIMNGLGDQPGEITYSWSNVNVHTLPKSKFGKGIKGTVMKIFGKESKSVHEKHILKDVSGICHPGELLAILGASGAGKTTLLNVLTYRNNDRVRTSGQLFINGRAVNPDYITKLSAYVQQDDLFVGSLTVKEQLIFQSMLRMDRYLTQAERTARVNEVISELGLTKCANTRIGVPGRIKGISGGEMKRLAFACEVLTNPPLLLCDEPTSGLDSFMAQNVVAVMKNMAEKGKTVISTIHQPSSEVYAMFDRIMLMSEGRVAFLGNADDAYEFFNKSGMPCPPNYNPADFFIDMLAVQPGREVKSRKNIRVICDTFAASSGFQDICKSVKENMEVKSPLDSDSIQWSSESRSVRKSIYKSSWMTQFRVLLWRSWLEISRDQSIINTRFLQVSLIAIILGLLFYKQDSSQEGVRNINGALFLFLTNMTFQNAFGAINTFCVQIPIFLREHFNGMYRTDVYFLSKTLAELPFFTIFPVIFVSICYYMIGFNPSPEHYFIAVLVLVFVANSATSFGYLISCASNNLDIALSIAAPFLVPLMLFGGFYLNRESIPSSISWIRFLSWFNYGNEALSINQWRGVSNLTCMANQTSCFRDGEAVLQYYHYDGGSIYLNIFDMFCLIVFYRSMAFLALYFKTLRKK